MEKQSPRQPAYRGIMMRLRALLADRRGLGAVEFALIAPLLLSLYITSFELTIGLSVSKRVTRSAGTVADLVTQQSKVTPTFLKTMLDVSASLFAPYVVSNLKMRVTGIKLDANSNPTVLWSWDQDSNKPYAKGSPVIIPSDMRSPNSFLVRAEVSVTHKLFMFMPGLLPDSVRNITIQREYFYRQRLGDEITCEPCA